MHSQLPDKDNMETNPIKPCGKTVLLVLLLSDPGPFPNKISCLFSTCVPSDNSLLSVRQELSFGPWKGTPSCNTLTLLLTCLDIVPIGSDCE